MVPEARGGGSFIVVIFLEARAKEIISESAILRKAVDVFADLKIDPTITDVFVKGYIFQ